MSRVRPRAAVALAAGGTVAADRFSAVDLAGFTVRGFGAVEPSAAEEEEAFPRTEVTGATVFAAFFPPVTADADTDVPVNALPRFSSKSPTRFLIIPLTKSPSPRFLPASRLWESENISRAWCTARRSVCGEERVYAVIS